MDTRMRVLPVGTYHGRLVSRATISEPLLDGRGSRCFIELGVAVAEGRYAGQLLTFRVWGEARMQRARALRKDETLVLAVTQTQLQSGRTVNRVVDFRAANEPSVAEIAKDSRVLTTAGVSHATTATTPELPDALRDQLVGTIRSFTPPMGPAATDQGQAVIAASVNGNGYGTDYKFGFYRSGTKEGYRTIVEYERTLQSLAELSEECAGQGPAHLSVFQYTADLQVHQDASEAGSLAGYRGRAWARWFAIDIDTGSAPQALQNAMLGAARVVDVLMKLGIPLNTILVFFSGSRGAHIFFPTSAFGAGPKMDFEGAARRLCCVIAKLASVTIDTLIYNPLAPLRAPNSRHDASGLFKVLLPIGELPSLSVEAIHEIAAAPRPFTMPDWRTSPIPVLVDLWIWACTATQVRSPTAAASSSSECWLFSDTYDLIQHGAPEGTRGERYFKAFMNVLECGCSPEFAIKLFGPSAQISGYPLNEFLSQLNGAVKAHELYSFAVND